MAAKRDRTEPSTEVTKVVPDFLMSLPDSTETGLEDMQEYRLLSRIKVIQAMSDEGLKDQFGGEGSVVVVPAREALAGKREPFLFVPIFGFTEFCKWSDRKDKGSNAIVDRTFNKDSELAARARDPEKRFEGYGDLKDGKPVYQFRYVEHLNFAGLVYEQDHPLYGTPVVLSYQRGEFQTGRGFITAMGLRRRNGRQVPMWAQVWQLHSEFRDQGDRKWWGLDHSNPEQPYILEDEVESFHALYKELKADFEQQRIRVDRTEDDPEDVAMTDDM